MYDDDKDKGIRFVSGQYNAGSERAPAELTIRGLLSRDYELLTAALLRGFKWVKRSDDGHLEFKDAKVPLPMATDKEMLPFWRKFDRKRSPGLQLPLLPTLSNEQHSSFCSIQIQHLCGYDYTPENYKLQAEKLEQLGFTCLRSRRTPEGCFHEIWHLPGLWSAKSGLKEAVEAREDKEDPYGPKALDRAVNYLCQNCSFGTLDVSFQRAAMEVD